MDKNQEQNIEIPYLGYIRTTLKGRVKELEKQEKKT